MAEKIQVHILGTPSVTIGDDLVKFPYRKTEGIFYYLCVEKNVTRDQLVNVFWADTDEKAGRKNVRQVLYQLKKCFGDDILVTQGNSSLMLNPEAPIIIDWDASGRDFLDLPGEFLSFFYIKDCPEFETWTEECRHRQKDRWREEIQRQIAEDNSDTDSRQIHLLLQRWIQTDPLSESIILTCMKWYTRTNQYNLAIQIYYDYRNRLEKELEEEPGDDINDAFRQVFRMKEAAMAEEYKEKDRFYGRSAEIYKIETEIQRFCSGEECTSLIIRGTAGVGKTALMDRIYERCVDSRATRIYVQTHPEDRDFYLRSFGEFLHQLKKCHATSILTLTPEQSELLELLLDLEHTPGGSHVFTGSTTFPLLENRVRDLLQSMGDDLRLTIFVDDLQWMDLMSSQLLQTVVREMGGSRVLLVATVRSDVSNPVSDISSVLLRSRLAETIDLNPFSREETEGLADLQMGSSLEPAVIDELYRRSDGNAFFLTDQLEALRRDGSLPDYVPEKTGDVLHSQLAKLSPEQLQLLQVLSIYMDGADIGELRLLMRRDILEIYDILEELQRRGLIREQLEGDSIRYLFRHRIYHEYIYDRQSLGKRRVWHQMVAEYYESKQGTEDWFELLPYIIYQYEKSGNAALARQYRVRFYCEFFALRNENFPELRTRMEYDEVTAGMEYDEAVVLEQARRVLTEDFGVNDSVVAQCHFLLGRADITRGRYEHGVEHISACIRMAEACGDRALLLAAYRQMVFYGIQVEDADVMAEYVGMGMECLKNEHHSSDYATFLRLKGLSLFYQDRDEEAEQCLQKAYSLFVSLRSIDCHYNLSRAACVNYLGRIYRRRGCRLLGLDEHGIPETPTDENCRRNTEMSGMTGQLSMQEGSCLSDPATSCGERNLSSEKRKNSSENRALAEAELDLAEQKFREAIDTGVCRYITNGMGQFHTNLGEVLMIRGCTAEAETSFREALKCFQANDAYWWGRDRMEAGLFRVCLQLGLRKEAGEHLELAETMIPAMKNPANMHMLDYCRELAEEALRLQ